MNGIDMSSLQPTNGNGKAHDRGGYPQREGHYAHKITRLLFKSCACQDLGEHAALLVIHVAHTEDAARYQGPIRFWNSQLNETLGFRSPKQLNTAREKAIKLGWLHYQRIAIYPAVLGRIDRALNLAASRGTRLCGFNCLPTAAVSILAGRENWRQEAGWGNLPREAPDASRKHVRNWEKIAPGPER